MSLSGSTKNEYYEFYARGRRKLNRRMFVAAIIVIGLALAAVRILFHFDIEMKVHKFRHLENTFLQVQKTFIGYGLLSVVNDMGVMIGHQHSAVALDLTGSDYKDEFRKEMVLLCQNRIDYIQIVIIDRSGDELLKVKCDKGRPEVVPAEELISHKGHQFFQKALHLSAGDVMISDRTSMEMDGVFRPVTNVISPFTIDHEENPYGDTESRKFGKPAMASSGDVEILQDEHIEDFSDPDAHGHDEISSYMVITYTGSNVSSLVSTNALHNSFTPQGGHLLVLNNNLVVQDSSFERYPVGGDASQLFGIDLAALKTSRTGSIDVGDGVLFYTFFDPIKEAARLSPSSRDELIRKFVSEGDVDWVVLSHVDNEMLPYSTSAFLIKSWTSIPVAGILIWLLFYLMYRQQFQRSLAQYRLDSQRKYLESVMASMVDGVVTTLPNGTILQSNKAAVDLIGHGLDDGDQVERKIQWFVQLHDRRVSHDIATWLTRFDHTNGQLLEGEIETKDEQKTPVEISINALQSSGEKTYLWVIRNITERKEAQAEIENLHRKYIHREKLAEAGLLSGGILHEVSNPLAAIQGMLASMVHVDDHREAPALNSEFRETISSIFEHIERVRNISMEVSSFLRPATNKKELSNLNGILTTAKDLLRFDKRWNAVEMQLDLDTSICAVEVVPDQITQVALNLISNACDAALTGGAEQPRIHISSWKNDLDICFSIKDNGIGMDDETKKRIFNPFFTTKSDRGGTGLGLPLVAGIIKDHQGLLTIESELGQGTTAICCLPIKSSE